jgi:hypothetical protein
MIVECAAESGRRQKQKAAGAAGVENRKLQTEEPFEIVGWLE